MSVAFITREIERTRKALLAVPKAAPAAIADALNRGVSRGKEMAKDQIEHTYTARGMSRYVKTKRASARRLEAAVVDRAPKAERLFKSAPEPSRAGFRGKYYQKGMPVHARPEVSAAVVVGRRKVIPGGFLQRLPNGATGIFIRRKGVYQQNAGQVRPNPIAGRKPRKIGKKEALQMEFAIGSPTMLIGKRVRPKVEKAMQQRVVERLRDNVERILAGKWRT